jgi:hypothetical protein
MLIDDEVLLLRALARVLGRHHDIVEAGFDDLLVGAGHAELATELHGAIEGAIADANAIEGALQQTIVADSPRVEQLHGRVKDVTDILEGPFVMALMLTLPEEGAGDAD